MAERARGAGPSGVLVVDKPRGPTSHDVVGRVRRALQTREVGHAGTLDPMATGVLVVAVGDATRLVPWLVDGTKTYTATVALGVETDTLDAQGRVSGRVEPSPALAQALAAWRSGDAPPLLEAALAAERARTEQMPPAFSAIHQGGERAYAKARRGPEEVILAPRPVSVRRLEVVACSAAELTVVVSVSTGYYVRALARDLAGALGTVGHLTALRRTAAGGFTVEEAVVVEGASPEALRGRLLAPAVAVARTLPVATLSAPGVVDARHGRRVAAEHLSAGCSGPAGWLDAEGALVAIGEVDPDGMGRVLRGFPERS